MILYQKRLSIYFKSMALLLLVTFAVPEATQSHLSFLAPKSPIQKIKLFFNKKELKQRFREENQALEQLIKTEVKTKEEFDQLVALIQNEYKRNRNSYYLTIGGIFLREKAQKILTDISPVEEDSYWNKIFNLCIKKSSEKKQEEIKEESKKIELLPEPQKQEEIKTESDDFLEGFLESARLEFEDLTSTTKQTTKTSVRLQRQDFNGKDPKLPKHVEIIFNTNRSKERLFYLKQPSEKNMRHKKFGLVTSVAGDKKTRKIVVSLDYQDQDGAFSILFYKFNASKKLITEELLIDKELSLTFKNSKEEEIPLLKTNAASFYGKTVELNLPHLGQLLVEKSFVLSPFYEGQPKDKFEKFTENIKRQDTTPITLSAVAWPLVLLLNQKIEFVSVLFYIVTFIVLYVLFLFFDALFGSLENPWSLRSLLKNYNLLKEEPLLMEDPFDPDTDSLDELLEEIEEALNPTPLHDKVPPSRAIATAL